MKRQVVIPIMAVVLYLVPFLALASCATRARILSGAFEGLTEVRDGFLKYDNEHQQQLVADALDYDSGTKALADYRAKREKVKTAITIAYGALTVANVDGKDESLNRAVDAVKLVIAAIKECCYVNK